jgi:hypothetical protein
MERSAVFLFIDAHGELPLDGRAGSEQHWTTAATW